MNWARAAIVVTVLIAACTESEPMVRDQLKRRCEDAQRGSVHGTFPDSFSAYFVEEQNETAIAGLPCSIDCGALLQSRGLRQLYVNVQAPDPTYGYPSDVDIPNSISRVVNAEGVWSYRPTASDACATPGADRGVYVASTRPVRVEHCVSIARATVAQASNADIKIVSFSNAESEGGWNYTTEGITASQGERTIFRETSVQRFRMVGGVPQTDAQCFVPRELWTQVLASYIEHH